MFVVLVSYYIITATQNEILTTCTTGKAGIVFSNVCLSVCLSVCLLKLKYY